MEKCPRCNCEATGQNRLVTDSCGHTKCRLCLVADVSDCSECRIVSQESARIPEKQEAKVITSADQRILVTDQGYHCTVCNKDFRSRTQQYYHLACGNELLKKFSCKECSRRFATRSHLNYHLSSHENQSKHSCNTCGKCFKQLIVLQRHMVTHSQEQYVCPHCQKVFRRQSSLNSHAAIHTALGLPYKCELCSKHFQNKANLNQHLRKHDKNSIRHKCKVCQKSFLRQTTLRLHMKRHLNRERLSCSLCDKSYNDVDALGRHLKQHKAVERYRCIQCDITVNRKDNMLRHLRSMHPGCAFESTVEIVKLSSSILEEAEKEKRPAEIVRYNSVIQSVGNVEPVMLPLSPPQSIPLPEVQLDRSKIISEHLPLPDAMPEENVQLYRKIILDLDNEEYSNELSLDETHEEPALQQSQPRCPGQGSSKFSEMHWRKNVKYLYENEHTN
ncbi:zinc finger protein 846 [Drosophila ficusphila]|uniref:zinc finger protein 846 n=1 Tax=Drosophila ficusphila TaxID=30025 RepID=UPI0007E88AB8|nr:zinc finger protein 846 [Drosophila ficusphila]